VDRFRAESAVGRRFDVAVNSVAAQLFCMLIRAYRLLVSPLLGSNCRFEPSCSHFAEAAIAAHGPWRGVPLALGRLLRCHPWGGPGGYDPVPRGPVHSRRKTT
jgi:putative membrane protein insertion efficiency factor